MVWTGTSGPLDQQREIFDPNAMTAASTTLPLGSRVRVTNPDNGRSVVVRVNDRGPFVKGRSLVDLSRRAAQQIGLTRKGVGRVQIAVASAPSYRKRARARPLGGNQVIGRRLRLTTKKL
jgi:rare lipoprotein A